ncbi:branched-chain amino acid aminotransferase [Cohaesibacter sp. ES.047]|uniref:branched-chain amino acid aminotransferase n=1 Tax=Cohaesibacter sp. ES.047 TaxID=1798205 RepID=UPI000BB85E79|nr:branched-chain amino acid aminotransferase [Cohaesibacter sp. ES.047]SNY91510.1 branched-chain amino acid aminotransferase [Cohaesibacter sp. ES.047]
MAGPAFDQHEGFIWYNGEYVEWKDAKLHVLSHGLHYGSTVFEGVRAYGGEIFKLQEHTDRLFRSAETLGMTVPYSKDEIKQLQKDIIAKEGLIDAYLRPVIWRGSEMMGISAQSNRINVAIAAWNWPSYFKPEDRLKGLRLATAEWRRPDPRTIPCHAKAAGLYMICTLSKHKVENEGYNDAMMLDYEGNVAEATGANIFFSKDGVLHTPIPDCFLDGITRQTVVDLARRRGIKVIERKIRPEELGDFEECFLTGTAVEVTPVASIDSNSFTPGAITTQLMDDYTSEVNPQAIAAE